MDETPLPPSEYLEIKVPRTMTAVGPMASVPAAGHDHCGSTAAVIWHGGAVAVRHGSAVMMVRRRRDDDGRRAAVVRWHHHRGSHGGRVVSTAVVPASTAVHRAAVSGAHVAWVRSRWNDDAAGRAGVVASGKHGWLGGLYVCVFLERKLVSQMQLKDVVCRKGYETEYCWSLVVRGREFVRVRERRVATQMRGSETGQPIDEEKKVPFDGGLYSRNPG